MTKSIIAAIALGVSAPALLFSHSALAEQNQETAREITVLVKTLTGKIIPIRISNAETVGDLKAAVTKKEGIPAGQQRLIFGGKQLDDSKALRDFGISNESTVFLVLKLG